MKAFEMTEVLAQRAMSGRPSFEFLRARTLSLHAYVLPPGGPDPREIAVGVFGALLDFPELLEDSATDEVVSLLEGDVALGVAALRRLATRENPLYAPEILAHLPPSLHTFASHRLAAPRHEHADEARMELQSNAQKLKRLGLSRQKAEIVEALQRAARTGDARAEDDLLREQMRRARERAGTKG